MDEKELFLEAEQKSIDGLKSMMFDSWDIVQKEFKRNSYEGSFRNYFSKYSDVYEAIQRACDLSEDHDEWIKGLAAKYVDAIDASYKSLKKKPEKLEFILNADMMLVAYIFPSLTESKMEAAKPLIDEIIKLYNPRFKEKISAGTYEEINGGFRKNRFCFITSAVCDAQGKPDDCYELTRFREYRDNYLLATEEGRADVETYYDIAPTIVTRISESETADAQYAQIWDRYLKPCLEDIEAGRLEDCHDKYRTMVLDLKQQYFM